jgi:hypothetical protein
LVSSSPAQQTLRARFEFSRDVRGRDSGDLGRDAGFRPPFRYGLLQ